MKAGQFWKENEVMTLLNCYLDNAEVGIKKICFVGNKIRRPDDEKYILTQLGQKNVMGFLSYEPALENSRAQFIFTPQLSNQIKSIIQNLRNV